MKSKLLILSDISGFTDCTWIKTYVDALNPYFHLTFYDSCELAGINRINVSKEEVHSQFINHGIDIAANKLKELETKEVRILAFSIGGTIAWKAGLKSLHINTLYAISSTRLRKEVKNPLCEIHLYYAEKDPFIPKDIWFESMGVEAEIIQNKQHKMYKTEAVAHRICMQIIKQNILEKICYTERVYDRINKKLSSSYSHKEIESFILAILQKTDSVFFTKTGKNYYVRNETNNIRITINSNTLRVITVDKMTK